MSQFPSQPQGFLAGLSNTLAGAGAGVADVRPQTGIGGFLKGLSLGAAGAQQQARAQQQQAIQQAIQIETLRVRRQESAARRQKILDDIETSQADMERNRQLNAATAQFLGLKDVPDALLSQPSDDFRAAASLKFRGANEQTVRDHLGVQAARVTRNRASTTDRLARNRASTTDRLARNFIEDAQNYAVADVMEADPGASDPLSATPRTLLIRSELLADFPDLLEKPLTSYPPEQWDALRTWAEGNSQRTDLVNFLAAEEARQRGVVAQQQAIRAKAQLRQEAPYPGGPRRSLFAADFANLQSGPSNSLSVRVVNEFAQTPAGQSAPTLSEFYARLQAYVKEEFQYQGGFGTPEELSSLIKSAPQLAHLQPKVEAEDARAEGRPRDRAAGQVQLKGGGSMPMAQFMEAVKKAGLDPSKEEDLRTAAQAIGATLPELVGAAQ